MERKLLLATLLAVVVSLVTVNAVHADSPYVAQEVTGLCPAAQEAAKVVGYGGYYNETLKGYIIDLRGEPACYESLSCTPKFYVNEASKMAALALGYGDKDRPVLK